MRHVLNKFLLILEFSETKSHLDFAISNAANTEADERKNRAEISIVFSCFRRKKSHLNFAMSITANKEADERKNPAEISIIFSWALSSEIDRG